MRNIIQDDYVNHLLYLYKEELTKKGFDMNDLTDDQIELIVEPIEAPENYMADGELTRIQAKTRWLKKLEDSGMNKMNIKKAKSLIK